MSMRGGNGKVSNVLRSNFEIADAYPEV